MTSSLQLLSVDELVNHFKEVQNKKDSVVVGLDEKRGISSVCNVKVDENEELESPSGNSLVCRGCSKRMIKKDKECANRYDIILYIYFIFNNLAAVLAVA